MATGGMTKGQARRSSKLKAKRAARRAADVVGVHKKKNLAKARAFATKKREQFASGRKTPHGTVRAKRREALQTTTHQTS